MKPPGLFCLGDLYSHPAEGHSVWARFTGHRSGEQDQELAETHAPLQDRAQFALLSRRKRMGFTVPLEDRLHGGQGISNRNEDVAHRGHKETFAA